MTAELLARCRAALQASDETARAATEPTWMGYVMSDGHCELYAGPLDESGYRTGSVLKVDADDENSYGPSPADMAFIEQNDPATRLALNAALRTVLDGIEATLTEHDNMDGCCGYCSPCWAPTSAEVRYDARGALSCRRWPCPDHLRATASLAAIATALGVEEADRG